MFSSRLLLHNREAICFGFKWPLCDDKKKIINAYQNLLEIKNKLNFLHVLNIKLMILKMLNENYLISSVPLLCDTDFLFIIFDGKILLIIEFLLFI